MSLPTTMTGSSAGLLEDGVDLLTIKACQWHGSKNRALFSYSKLSVKERSALF